MGDCPPLRSNYRRASPLPIRRRSPSTCPPAAGWRSDTPARRCNLARWRCRASTSTHSRTSGRSGRLPLLARWGIPDRQSPRPESATCQKICFQRQDSAARCRRRRSHRSRPRARTRAWCRPGSPGTHHQCRFPPRQPRLTRCAPRRACTTPGRSPAWVLVGGCPLLRSNCRRAFPLPIHRRSAPTCLFAGLRHPRSTARTRSRDRWRYHASTSSRDRTAARSGCPPRQRRWRCPMRPPLRQQPSTLPGNALPPGRSC